MTRHIGTWHGLRQPQAVLSLLPLLPFSLPAVCLVSPHCYSACPSPGFATLRCPAANLTSSCPTLPPASTQAKPLPLHCVRRAQNSQSPTQGLQWPNFVSKLSAPPAFVHSLPARWARIASVVSIQMNASYVLSLSTVCSFHILVLISLLYSDVPVQDKSRRHITFSGCQLAS